MHELSIAQAIVDRVAHEVKSHPGARPVEVGILVGEISGVDKDALAFGFAILAKDAGWADLNLNVEYRSRRHSCTACGHEFTVASFDTSCPGCGNLATVMLAGDELDIAYIEVEDL
jgi:hydrogenase nickel incorporation protein HypA/HybF